MHALLSSKKDPRRLRSCNNEAVCAVHLAINHELPYDKSSVALNCYVNLVLVSAFAGQMLLTGIENNRPTSEAEWRKYTCVVGHWLKKLGTGDWWGGDVRAMVSDLSPASGRWAWGRERTCSIQIQDERSRIHRENLEQEGERSLDLQEIWGTFLFHTPVKKTREPLWYSGDCTADQYKMYFLDT